MNIDAELELILKGTQEVLPGPDALRQRLVEAREAGRPLRVKLGIDPSGTDIHVGHTVPLWKLRQFQDLGHQAVLIIGDYTAMLGDPSGRNAVRPQLTHAQVVANAESYKRQISEIVDLDSAEVVYNGDWFRDFTLLEVIHLAATTTLMRMLERKDFKERVEAQKPLFLHELLYPLMQGWDSVQVRADIELGATDQVFNILKGRELMESEGQPPQIGLTLPLLIGLDGALKMGKSTGNYIGLNEAPEDMYGKVMSIPDALIVHYTELALPSTVEEVEAVRRGLEEGSLDPMRAKLDLARRITAQYAGVEAADRAADHFKRVVRQGGAPRQVPRLTLEASQVPLSLLDLVMLTGVPSSKSEGRRLITQGGVRLNDEPIDDPFVELSPDSGSLLRVGKRRFFEVERP